MNLYLLILAYLTPILIVRAVQEFVVIPRLRRELFELNARRARRVQQALARTTEPAWMNTLPAPNFPFAGWLELLPDGSLKIAGKTFWPADSFQVTARDDHNISRTSAMCQGNGDVLIQSHGQSFVARFNQNQWQVQPAGVQPP